MSDPKSDEPHRNDVEAAAEAELLAAHDASSAVPPDQSISGLGPSPAPLFIRVRPKIQPAQYDTALGPGEKMPVLTYFAIPGLGESVRLLLAEVGAEYNHVAVVGGEDQSVACQWRDRSPNGLLPLLSGVGIPRSRPICQSGAVMRYLARRYGLMGEGAMADVLYETAKDIGGHVDKICAVEPEKDMTAYKLPFAAAARVLKMLRDMPDPADEGAALNLGQVQLYSLLRRCEARRSGCVKGNLGEDMDNFRRAMEKRPGIKAYLESGACFPFTNGDMGTHDTFPESYQYASGPITRGEVE